MKTLEITRLELVGFGKFRERTIDLTRDRKSVV